jgi:hypothetical protein
MILTLLNDTTVFFATSGALMKNAYKDVTIQNGLMVVLLERISLPSPRTFCVTGRLII